MEYQQHELKPGIDEYQHRVAQLAALSSSIYTWPESSASSEYQECMDTNLCTNLISGYQQ